MLRQVNDFALAYNDEVTAKELYKMIGSRLGILNETKDPFTYLGLITNLMVLMLSTLRNISELHVPTISIGSTPAMDGMMTSQ